MIQELIIINQAGIALFYHNLTKDHKIDDKQSLASYFDVICRFTKQSFKESLRMLTLDSYVFYFYTHKSHFHLVIKCENKKLDKKILEDLAESIIENFLEKYKEVLEDFNGEISLFSSFSDVIERILTSKIKHFKKTLILEY